MTFGPYRGAFALPAGVHYLNCAYMAPQLRTAEIAGRRALRRYRDPSHIQGSEFFDLPDRVRTRFAALIGAPHPERIAILPSMSYGMATAARNLAPRPGTTVVHVEYEYPASVLTWRRSAAARGGAVRVVRRPTRARDRGREWNARLISAIDRRTSVVFLSPVHWIHGTAFDLDAVAVRARECGARLVIDGTQAVGAIPLDIARLRPDALICAAYKWLLGPYSIALAYYGPAFDRGTPIEETWTARANSRDVGLNARLSRRYGARAARYDGGERSDFVLLPMLEAGLRQLAAWRPARIGAYCATLTRRLLEQCAALGCEADAREAYAEHVVSLELPCESASDRLSAELVRRRIAISRRGPLLRISPHVYNVEADVDILAAAIASALRRPRR